MPRNNAYVWTGLGLLVAGGLMVLAAYFIIEVAWLVALGISMLILAAILLALSRSVPTLSPQASRLLLQTGIDNIEAMVEELGITSRAVYLPSSRAGGRPQALIPLRSGGVPPSLDQPLPQRLIVRYGTGQDDFGLLLATVGSAAAGMLDSKPPPSAEGLEGALTQLFTGVLGVADGVRVVSNDGSLNIEVRRPRLEHLVTFSGPVLGGPLASIAATVAAEAFDRPVTIEQDEPSGTIHRVGLRLQ